jgi:Na+/melibiose symporter-like transporter
MFYYYIFILIINIINIILFLKYKDNFNKSLLPVAIFFILFQGVLSYLVLILGLICYFSKKEDYKKEIPEEDDLKIAIILNILNRIYLVLYILSFLYVCHLTYNIALEFIKFLF